MFMANTKRRRLGPKNTIVPPGSCHPRRPDPFPADEGGAGAELEEGGRDLERERDAGEGVCRVRWAWTGWNDDGGGFVVEEGGS